MKNDNKGLPGISHPSYEDNPKEVLLLQASSAASNQCLWVGRPSTGRHHLRLAAGEVTLRVLEVCRYTCDTHHGIKNLVIDK